MFMCILLTHSQKNSLASVSLCLFAAGRAIGTLNIDGQRTHQSVAECRRRSDETILAGHAATYIRRTLTLNSRERM
jgi:hypothetical protein